MCVKILILCCKNVEGIVDILNTEFKAKVLLVNGYKF